MEETPEQEEGLDADEQHDNKRSPADHLFPYRYKKGQSGNPAGRPIGSVSLKEYARRKLASMTDEEREEFMDGIDKRIIWEMSEGKAKQDVDIKGEIVSKVISVDE